MLLKRIGLIVLACVLALGASSVQADTVYTLGIPNSGGLDCCNGPYATADVHLTDATHATVTFTSLDNGGYLYLMADGGSAAVNVNASSWAISGIVGTNGLLGFTPGPYTDGGSSAQDGFGTFNQNVNDFDGFTHSATQITFNLQDLSGSWASDAVVLSNNAAGFLASIHGFACANPCTIAEGAFATGYAANGGGSTQAPEPSASMLLGLGLFGVGLVSRKALSV